MIKFNWKKTKSIFNLKKNSFKTQKTYIGNKIKVILNNYHTQKMI